jgi:hypothetical protein
VFCRRPHITRLALFGPALRDDPGPDSDVDVLESQAGHVPGFNFVSIEREFCYYSKIHGTPPAEADFQRFFGVTPPVVHQMIKTLHARGFIDREPGKARSIKLRLTRAELPDLD